MWGGGLIGPCSWIWRPGALQTLPLCWTCAATSSSGQHSVSQSVSQQWARLPHGHCVETFNTTKWKLLDKRRRAVARRAWGTHQEDVFYESGTCAPLIKVLFPTRACLNPRRALEPCVGQTTSTNEWQQQSGGMILRRGSVVAALLLCFLAKVRARRRAGSISSAAWMYFDCLCVYGSP